MSTKTWVLTVVDAAVWYAFIYLWLYTLKNSVDLRLNALALLVLAVIGVALCPLVYKLDIWEK